MKRFFGCHVSASGGLEKALGNGAELGVNTIQLHPCPPQKWNTKPFAPGVEEAFLADREGSNVEKVFFHGIYLINLANPDLQKFHLAKLSLLHDLDLISRLKGDGVIFHVGSMKHQEDESIGLKHAAEGINWIMNESKNDGRLLLEVAAGSGSVIGDRVEELAEIYSHVEKKDRVGFALDSQHMWASGYDLVSDLDSIISHIDEVLGLHKIWAIHLNDSKTDLGSKIDRHENIGDGKIGKDALTKLLNHKKLEKIPFILETPALKSMETARLEVDKVKTLLSPA